MAYFAWQMVQDIYFLSGFHVEANQEMEPFCEEAYEQICEADGCIGNRIIPSVGVQRTVAWCELELPVLRHVLFRRNYD